MGDGNTVRLRDLLNVGYETHFETRFKQYVYLYNGGHPGDEYEKPPGNPGGGPQGPEGDPSEIIQEFIDYLTVENCVELFMPNGLNSVLMIYPIITTAHPLNSDTENTGYLRHTSMVLLDKPPVLTMTEEITVDQEYVDTGAVVIIARPFKEDTVTCNYSEYGTLDFTEFLNN